MAPSFPICLAPTILLRKGVIQTILFSGLPIYLVHILGDLRYFAHFPARLADNMTSMKPIKQPGNRTNKIACNTYNTLIDKALIK
jgi:hypothetical protein